MIIYTVLAFDFGEDQCYWPRGKGKNYWLHVPGSKSSIFVHKKTPICTSFISVTLWVLSQWLVPGAGTYLPAVSGCATASAWCEHRQRLPGGGGSASEYQFSRAPRHAMLILTPTRCQHWFLNSSVGGNTNRAVMFLPHSRHGDMSAKSKRLFRRSFRESDGISNGGEKQRREERKNSAPFSPFHSPVRSKAAARDGKLCCA